MLDPGRGFFSPAPPSARSPPPQPPRLVKAGESFVIPAGTVHDAHNASDKAPPPPPHPPPPPPPPPSSFSPVRLLGVYVVEKGKPLATPAP